MTSGNITLQGIADNIDEYISVLLPPGHLSSEQERHDYMTELKNTDDYIAFQANLFAAVAGLSSEEIESDMEFISDVVWPMMSLDNRNLLVGRSNGRTWIAVADRAREAAGGWQAMTEKIARVRAGKGVVLSNRLVDRCSMHWSSTAVPMLSHMFDSDFIVQSLAGLCPVRWTADVGTAAVVSVTGGGPSLCVNPGFYQSAAMSNKRGGASRSVFPAVYSLTRAVVRRAELGGASYGGEDWAAMEIYGDVRPDAADILADMRHDSWGVDAGVRATVDHALKMTTEKAMGENQSGRAARNADATACVSLVRFVKATQQSEAASRLWESIGVREILGDRYPA